MHEKIAKLMAKKKGRPMDELEKEAKMSVIKDLGAAASEAMRGKLDGLKKVTVASDSPEGLTHGLKKAEEIVQGMPGMKDAAEHDEEMMEDAEDGEGRDGDELAGGVESDEDAEDMAEEGHDGEHEDMSEEELDAKLAELMDKKKKLEAKKKA